jgi:hypothetical protein
MSMEYVVMNGAQYVHMINGFLISHFLHIRFSLLITDRLMCFVRLYCMMVNEANKHSLVTHYMVPMMLFKMTPQWFHYAHQCHVFVRWTLNNVINIQVTIE